MTELEEIEASLPPHDIAAERAALGAAMFENALIDQLNPEWFYDLKHRNFSEGLKNAAAKDYPVDVGSLRTSLAPVTLAECGGNDYVMAHIDTIPSPANFGYYRMVLDDHLARRKLIVVSQLTTEKIRTGELTTEEIQTWAEAEILKIRQKDDAGGRRSVKQLIHESIEAFENATANIGKLHGVQTGFVDLDVMTNGLEPADMFVIAARPSVGKTSFAMNIAEHTAVDQLIPTAVFSLEMSATSLIHRLHCSRARVDSHTARRQGITDRDGSKLIGAGAQIAKSPLYIIESSGWSISQIQAEARKLVAEHGIKVVIVDYIQIVGSGKGDHANLNEHVSAISSGLKRVAGENKVVMIALSQLNREVTKENRKPRLSDLRDSGAVEQDADLVGLMHEDKDSHSVELIIAKNRNGPIGSVFLTFLKYFTRFESAAKVSHADI